MKRSGILFTNSLLAASLMASNATAGGPSSANSSVPAHIRLVGAASGVADAATGQFKVIARDVANLPFNGCSIVVDFSACTNISLCADQLDPSALVNCAAKTVRKFSNIQGEAEFVILGHSSGPSEETQILERARVFGNGVLLGTPAVSSFDLDGSRGVGSNDLSVWLSDYASGRPYPRSDYDGNEIISANDLSQWLEAFAAARSVESCSAACP